MRADGCSAVVGDMPTQQETAHTLLAKKPAPTAISPPGVRCAIHHLVPQARVFPSGAPPNRGQST